MCTVVSMLRPHCVKTYAVAEVGVVSNTYRQIVADVCLALFYHWV
jgi:hypothetical protein